MTQRPTDVLTRTQIGVILGLELVFQHSGLILTCPRCAANGQPELETGNHPSDTTWKIDCACRKRRFPVKTAAPPMEPSAALMLMADSVLTPVSLAVRCPSAACVTQPLTIQATTDGARVTCHCGGVVQFRKTAPVTAH